MRIHLASTAALLLAGCHVPSSDTAGAADQPNEMIVESQLQNEEDGIDDDIKRDADAAASNDNDRADADTPDRYGCDNGLVVQVTYGTDDGTARLTIAGRTMALLATDAASGGQYKTDDGIAPGRSLTWRADGTDAKLIQAPRGMPPGSPLESVTSCKAMD
jgi:membrane-bound inhibitor of C-type lysozyme